MIRIVVEAAVLPPRVHLEGNRPAHGAPAGESGGADKADARLAEGSAERVLIELRVLRRPRKPAHIHDELHRALLEQRRELHERPVRMPDREESTTHRPAPSTTAAVPADPSSPDATDTSPSVRVHSGLLGVRTRADQG